ncbi:MAG: hypothetical protein JJU45_17890 [Acidimicrobiia bacterium]|nr:hypothetical protein [Acidimicrobiia bacterium]
MGVRLFHRAAVLVACAGLVVSCSTTEQAVAGDASDQVGSGASTTTTDPAAANPAEDPSESIELVDYGFSIYSTGNNGGRSWAVILENPTDMTAVDVAVTVGFTSVADPPPPVSGTALPHAPEAVDYVSETEVIPFVPPGRFAWSREQSGGSLNMGPEHVWSVSVMPPVEIDVDVEVGGWRATTNEDGPIVVDPSSVSLERAPGLENPRWIATAVATSQSDVELERPAVVAVFRNDVGDITGGARWQASCLRPHRPGAVTVRQLEALEDEHVASVEVFVLPYGLKPQIGPTDPGGCPRR